MFYRWTDDKGVERGAAFARLLQMHLAAVGLTNVWLDKEQLPGKITLKPEVHSAMTSSVAIMFVIAPGDLDRCNEEKDDFLRWEMETAISLVAAQPRKLLYWLLWAPPDGILDVFEPTKGSKSRSWSTEHKNRHSDQYLIPMSVDTIAPLCVRARAAVLERLQAEVLLA